MNADALLQQIRQLREPEEFSPAELLRRCQEQRRTLIEQEQSIHRLAGSLAHMSRAALISSQILSALADSYDAGDAVEVARQIRALSDNRRAMQVQKGRMH